MGQALYRKYRSRKLDEVVGQDSVVKTLKQALRVGQVSHAYLFTGPHGVGKTSVARILAHEVNSLPYEGDTIHLDIIEIDAASNRRIDEIRDLRDKVNIAPTSAKYKVYIIDEVHMLTKEAFNALLKTLEEPPAHCIFILATTEAHKLPETIISRTQRFNFKPISTEHSAAHLAAIAKIEKLDITPEALALLAEFGEGSLRDSISLLDQLSSQGRTVDEKLIRSSLGLPAATAIDKLLQAAGAGDNRAVLAELEQLRQQGVNPAILAKALSAQLRQMIIKEPGRAVWAAALVRALAEVSASLESQESLEISLLEAGAQMTTSDQPASQTYTLPEEVKAQKPQVAPTIKSQPVAPTGNFKLDDWPRFLAAVKQQATALYTALRLAEPSQTGNKLTLAFAFSLHQKKLDQPEARRRLEQIATETFGAKLIFEMVLDKSLAKKTLPKTPPKPSDQMQIISNIFGGGEVLES